MPLILVAEPEGRHVERIRNALGGEGFEIRAVADSEEALTVARGEPPRLALVSSEMDQSQRLLQTFSRRTGGPGAIALVPERRADVTSQAIGADELISKPFTDQDLRMAVRRVLSGATDATAEPSELFADEGTDDPSPPTADKQLTSEDIFGDLVAEFESETSEPPARTEPEPATTETAAKTPPPSAAHPTAEKPSSRDLDRTLEQTLAGLENLTGRPKKKKKGRRRPLDDSDVDALLSETLSGLDLSRPRRTPRPPASGSQPPAPEPAVPEPTPELSIPEPVDPVEPPPPEPVVEEEPVAAAPEAVEAPSPAAPTTPDGLNEADPRNFGQYELLDRIAVGGMAEVWKARMTGVEGFQKTVAIKRILSHLTGDEDFVRMFVDEAKLAAQLNHPNIIHIYDLGKIREHYFIAMEYVEGMNLRGVLNATRKKGISLPRGLALLIAARLASALDHAHHKKDEEDRELGLVHRDVSPQNVLLSYEGDIKLCDFGIVKAVTKSSQTQMGALKGKLQYMSPEQAWGKPVDARSDLFSLGALLFEMLTGRRLFGGDSEISVLEAVRQCRFTAPRNLDPSIPEEVEEIVLEILEHDPDKRFQTAGQVQQRLEEVLYELRPTPGPADLGAFLRNLRDAPELDDPEQEPPAASAPEVLDSAPAAEVPETEDEIPISLDFPKEEEEEQEAKAEADEAFVIPDADAAATVRMPVIEPPSETAPAAEDAEPNEAVEEPVSESPEDATEATSAEDEAYEPAPSRGSQWIWIVVGTLVVLAALAAAYYFSAVYEPAEPASLPPSAATAPLSEPEASEEPETPTDAEEPDAEGPPEGSQDATAPPDVASEAEPAQAASDEVDLDALVASELAKREAELRRQFEARERELARQIEEARARDAEPPPSDDPESDGDG